MQDLFAAIETLYSQTTGSPPVHNPFFNALPGGLANTEIPQYPNYPYAVFQLISGVPDHLFTNTTEEALIQFTIIDNSGSSQTICNVFDALDALYDNCVLPTSVYGFLSMLREFQQLLRVDEVEGGFWQYVVQYRVVLQKN
jgi:hypothetical protein